MKSKFYKEIKNKIIKINAKLDISFYDRVKIRELCDRIKKELISSIDYINYKDDSFKIKINLTDFDYDYFFGVEISYEDVEFKSKIDYLKELCSYYDITLEYKTKDLLVLYATLDNPNKDNKLILQKKK